jgi:hypothetical protein
MSIINTLLLSMRYELQDITGDTYSDYVLMDQYNKGNKLLRKTILDHLPMQLAEETPTGSTVAAEQSITLPKKPIKIIDFRLNKRKIDKVSISEIPDKTTTGEPRAYYLLNTSTIKLYPIPDKTYSYEITYIPESVAMAETDDSGYQTDVEELLVRYVVASLTGKGFDLVAEYNSTIGSLLSGIETGVTVVNGYYSDREGRGDYN